MSRRPARIVELAALLTLLALPSGLAVVPATPAHAAEQCAPAENKTIAEPSWAQRRMAAERVWPLTRGTVTVAVVDTGVSAAAPALAGAVFAGTDLSGGRGDSDCSGHGTFLAGLLAARPTAGTAFAGIAPAARLLPVRVTDDPAQVKPERLAAGIRAAVDGGARVIAVGLTTTELTANLQSAVALAVQRDVLVVASVGSKYQDRQSYPAALPGVLAVAPLAPDGPLPTSAYGAKPALAAPAQTLIGIAPTGTGQRLGSAPELAVAYVAAAAALVRDYRPGLTADEVTERLLATADHPAGPIPNPLIGYGIVDPTAAVTTILAPVVEQPAPGAEPVAIPRPTPPDRGPARRALWFALTAAALAIAVAAITGLATLRRRRIGTATTGP